MADDTRTFAKRLKAIMREQKIGNERLAFKSGISSRLIAKYRAGTTEPRDGYGDPSHNAHKLAEALGVDLDELMPPRQRIDEKQPNGHDEPVAA